MDGSELLDITLGKLRLFGRSTLYLVLYCILVLPAGVRADIVYGTVRGVIADNLTLTIYKGKVMVAAAAIRPVGAKQYEYRLNLTPGTYTISYKGLTRPLVNYPGTNRVNIDYSQ